MKLYDLEVVTPERRVLTAKCSFMILRSADGDIGILPGHTPLITGVVPTPVDLRLEDRRAFLYVSGGFLEVRPEKVTLLARTAEAPESIDVDRARAAKARAEERLRAGGEDTDIQRAKAALTRAEARLKTVLLAKGV